MFPGSISIYFIILKQNQFDWNSDVQAFKRGNEPMLSRHSYALKIELNEIEIYSSKEQVLFANCLKYFLNKTINSTAILTQTLWICHKPNICKK